jgi:hypothetical protein
MSLTAQQLDAYARDGFIALGQVLDATTLAGLRAEEASLRASPTNPDNDNRSTRFWSLVARHCPVLRRCALDGPQMAAVEAVIGPDICLWWNQFVTKLPDRDTSGVFPWHQDNGYGDLSVPGNVTVWIALDDVDQDNGCVWVQPGSHRHGLLPHRRPNEESWHLEVPVAGDGIAVPMPAGHAVMFSGLTLHRSLANRSANPRRALFLEYAHPASVVLRPDHEPRPLTEHPETWVVRGRAPFPLPRPKPVP